MTTFERTALYKEAFAILKRAQELILAARAQHEKDTPAEKKKAA